MTAISLSCWSESDQKAIHEQLVRILNSGPFHQSQRRQRFLEYLVNETLAGRGERLKAYNVALEVFDRPETFDPTIDPLVRIEAARLREKLREYYGTEGQSDAIHIDLPKGTYAPLIEFRGGEQPVKSVSKRRMRWHGVRLAEADISRPEARPPGYTSCDGGMMRQSYLVALRAD